MTRSDPSTEPPRDTTPAAAPPEAGPNAPAPPGPASWTVLSDESARTEPWRERIEALLQRAPDRHLFHSFPWMFDAAAGDGPAPVLFALRRGDELVGYAPFMVQPWSLRFQLGELTLLRRPLQRLSLIGGPLFVSELGDEARMDETRALLAAVRPALPPRHVVFIEGLPLDRARAYERAGFHVVRYGAPFPHHSIDLPDDFAAYMQRLSKRTREGLRRNRRKLVKRAEDGLSLDVIKHADDVDRFVDDAVEVSKKTYQWKLLGLGLRDAAGLKSTMRMLAGHGMTCCFMLRVAGEAVAFMIGYRRADTYYYIDVGFDPEWTEQSVGTVLHMDAIEHLIERETGLRHFDFSTGTGTHKERFGTTSRTETNLLLVPRGVRGATLAGAYRAADGCSRGLSAVLDRLRVKDGLKKWLRRRASEK